MYCVTYTQTHVIRGPRRRMPPCFSVPSFSLPLGRDSAYSCDFVVSLRPHAADVHDCAYTAHVPKKVLLGRMHCHLVHTY